MTVCRESGVEATDDLYPGNKPGEKQNFEIHSPHGSVNISFHFPPHKKKLLTDMAASMAIRGQMQTTYAWIPN